MLTVPDRRHAARELASRMYHRVDKTASLNLDDLTAAVGAIDDLMDALPVTLDPTRTVQQNLVGSLPEPFRSASTPPEKALALVVWVLQETGAR